MASTFTMAELASFEQNFKPAAPVATVPPPANEPAANQTPAPNSDTLENQPGDSPAPDTALGDDNVDSSIPADTTTAGAPDDSDPADLTSEADPQPAKPKSRAQARIEDLVASNKALKASLDYMQNQVLAKLPTQQPQTQVTPPAGAQPAAADEAAPTLESCGYDTDKWTKAMHAWTDRRIEGGVTRAVQTVKQEQTVETRVNNFRAREAAFAAAAPDYAVVIGNPALPRLAGDVAATVMDSEMGPQIIYHLGKNPEKAAKIARMNPVQQGAAIGRLEAELTAAKPKTQKTPTNNITRAPNPPTPTQGRGNTPSVDPSKMSAKEWIEWDRQQTLAKRRAAKAARTA
jgi:hypothetical protein